MREIIFRGKTKEGEWVDGSLVQNKDKIYILPNYVDDIIHEDEDIFTVQGLIEVLPETVGQYLNCNDKNKKDIFSGDIGKMVTEVYYESYYESIHIHREYIGEIILSASAGVCLKNPICIDHANAETFQIKGFKKIAFYRTEIIGNKYDNPELLNTDETNQAKDSDVKEQNKTENTEA